MPGSAERYKKARFMLSVILGRVQSIDRELTRGRFRDEPYFVLDAILHDQFMKMYNAGNEALRFIRTKISVLETGSSEPGGEPDAEEMRVETGIRKPGRPKKSSK